MQVLSDVIAYNKVKREQQIAKRPAARLRYLESGKPKTEGGILRLEQARQREAMYRGVVEQGLSLDELRLQFGKRKGSAIAARLAKRGHVPAGYIKGAKGKKPWTSVFLGQRVLAEPFLQAAVSETGRDAARVMAVAQAQAAINGRKNVTIRDLNTVRACMMLHGE